MAETAAETAAETETETETEIEIETEIEMGRRRAGLQWGLWMLAGLRPAGARAVAHTGPEREQGQGQTLGTVHQDQGQNGETGLITGEIWTGTEIGTEAAPLPADTKAEGPRTGEVSLRGATPTEAAMAGSDQDDDCVSYNVDISQD